MSTHQPPTTPYMYPDRSERLVLMGFVQILVGCLCGLMAVMMVAVSLVGLMPRAPQGPSLNMQTMVPAMVFYLALAVVMTWLGIGLVRARRWAWTLTVVVSWMWLIFGLIGFVFFLFGVGPMMLSSVAQQGTVPREVILAMVIVSGVFAACIYIVLPGVFLVVCHHESVRATCQRRDPKIRWTDRCPMPVLAVSILLAASVALVSSVLAYG